LKLKQLIGETEIEKVKYAYAVQNQRLVEKYEEYLHFLKERMDKRPETFKKETWKQKDDVSKREYLLKHLQSLLTDENSFWNDEVYFRREEETFFL